ncbi:hypothetical protein R2R32_05730 [Clostridium perfringens]|nr:hypothetical protein [Clostridium perfringens]
MLHIFHLNPHTLSAIPLKPSLKSLVSSSKFPLFKELSTSTFDMSILCSPVFLLIFISLGDNLSPSFPTKDSFITYFPSTSSGDLITIYCSFMLTLLSFFKSFILDMSLISLQSRFNSSIFTTYCNPSKFSIPYPTA